MILNSPYISGSLTVTGNEVVTGSLTVLGGITGAITGSATSASYAFNSSYLNNSGSGEFVPTGSFNTFSSSILSYTASNNTNIGNINVTTASLNTFSGSANSRLSSIESTTASLNTASGSAITRLSALEVTSGSNITRIGALETASGSAITRLSALEVTSGSNITRLSSLESKTGSYATTGSNTFDGGQYISQSSNPTGFTTTASLYTDGGLRVAKDAYISGTLYLNNVTVYGTQSVCYITSSQLNIASNLISVNTATPSVRFGGLAVYDSGSTGLTGSILWDSQNNHWVYSNPSGSSYSGGMFISGPRTATLGSETGTTSCMLLAGQGGDHLTSSMIYHDSTVTCIPNTLAGGIINSSISTTSTACSTLNLISGCVGIGGINPSNPLHIYTNVNGPSTAIKIHNGSACAGATTGIEFELLTDYCDYKKAEIRAVAASSYANEIDLAFWSGGSTTDRHAERMRILATGETCFACTVCSNGLQSSDSLIIRKDASVDNRYIQLCNTETGGYRWDLVTRSNAQGCGFGILNNPTSQYVLLFNANGIANFACQVCAPAFIGGVVSGTTLCTSNGIIGNNSNNLYLSSNSSAGEISFWGNQLNTRLMTLTGCGNLGIGCVPSSAIKLQVYQCDVALNAFRAQHVNGNAILVNASYNYYDAYEHNFRCLGGGATYLTIGATGAATFTGRVSSNNSLQVKNNGYRELLLSAADATNRWNLYSYGVDETGGNAGGDLYLASYDDSGNYLRGILSINRNTGLLTHNFASTLKGTLTLGSAGVTNAVINSADGMYFNIDSDGSGSTPEFMFGKGRSGAGSGGTTFMTIANSGCIGINTTSPCALLHITAPSTNGVLFPAILNNPYNQGVTGYGVGLRLQNSTISGAQETHKWAGVAAIAGGSSGYSNETDLAFYVGCFIAASNCTCPPVEKMRIKSSTGYVGIGTTSPFTLLHVNGTPDANYGNQTLFDNRSAATNYGGVISFAGYKTSTAAANVWAQIAGRNEAGDGSENGYLSFITNTGTTYAERLRITSAGIACFSNTICASNFVTSFTGNMYIYRLNSGNYASFTTDGSGNISFYNGTGGTPSIRYTTYSDGLTCFACQVCSANGFRTGDNSYLTKSTIRLRSSNNNKYLDLQATDTCAIIASNFGDSDVPLIIGSWGGYQNNQLFLSTNCNVGIWTNNPAYRLDVSGPARVGTLLVSNNTTTTWCVGRINDARANTWYTIYTWTGIYDGAFALAQLGYEDNNGDGANAHALWMTTGAAYSTGASTTQIGGATNLCLQRSGQSLQALITGVTDRTGGAYIGYTVQTMNVAS